MAGISSRIGNIAIQTQSGKGVAGTGTPPSAKYRLAAQPSLAPVKEVGRLVWTDSGRDPGPAFTSRLAVAGDFQVYAHPAGLALLFKIALGANADSGAGPFTHTITPANDVFYVTIWRMVGNVVFEKFVDCKVNTLRLEGEAGQPLKVTLSVEGITATFEPSEVTGTALADMPYLYPEGSAALKVDTVARPLSRISLEIGNGISSYQADDYKPADVDPGAREITLSYGTRFTGATAFPDYRTFYYGSAGGTVQSPLLGTHAIDFTWTRDANTTLQILIPQYTYAALPVNADPGGDPIEIEVTGTVEKSAGAAIMTAIVKDAVATPG